LRQYAIDRGEPHLFARGKQVPVDVLGSEVMRLRRLLQDAQDFKPWQRRFEAGLFEIGGIFGRVARLRHVSLENRG